MASERFRMGVVRAVGVEIGNGVALKTEPLVPAPAAILARGNDQGQSFHTTV